MIANDFFKTMSKKAQVLIEDTFRKGSHQDYRKIKLLFDECIFESNGFPPVAIDISSFNWEGREFDRNWWWQLQPLPFLEWYCNSYTNLTEHERIEYYKACLEGTLSWAKYTRSNSNSPLAWQDHVVAYRTKNISNWLSFCYLKGIKVCDDTEINQIFEILITHISWMDNDNNYSKHTNHGFDQAMMGLMASLISSHDYFTKFQDSNRTRILDEVDFAFTPQGVHKENSPGYQKTMLRRLKQMKELLKLGEEEVGRSGEKYVADAESFLAAITLPNMQLPMIGDTRGYEEGLRYMQRDTIDVCDYSKSGYVIIRGLVMDKEFHLVFKNSHLSHYHRHDDDLSIHLYYDGLIILGDGGLGSHNEADPNRKAIRSYRSHSAPYIYGKSAIRVPSQLNGFCPQLCIKGNVITGYSNSYGTTIRRDIDLSNLSNGIILIKDSAPQVEGDILSSHYYSRLDMRVGEEITFGNDSEVAKIKISGDHCAQLAEEIHSDKFGRFDEAKSVTVSREKGKNRNLIEVQLSLCA